MNKMRNTALALAAASALAGCATGPDRTPGDPLEPMNRVIFKVNDAVDRTIAVPVAKGYQKVTPQPIRTAVSNFFSNLGDVGNFANNLLQLKITDATEDLMRLTFNTVFGLGGLIDWATPAGLPKHHQDFGLTLGRWGVPSGPYLVLPLFGPSSFRDGVGRAADVYVNPLNFTSLDPEERVPLYVLQFVSARADLLGATNLLEAAALDKYSFVRDAYVQQRKALLNQNSSKPPALPNYGDEGEAEAPNAASAAGAATPAPAAPASGSTPATPAPASAPSGQ
ncbi:VacJ family lipoprotein [Trinickia terrae]|uniref:VacJ family lipoprotein n=1 Tax=Trinickia terrae TaxID=2571161 RepID=A0A4U1I4Z9_9BURK|nr:VacJ family lipoprotein [Trinickia terrae]TKC88378.1 VacJ family lipoprotein [Trinickia terrae]